MMKFEPKIFEKKKRKLNLNDSFELISKNQFFSEMKEYQYIN